QIFHVQYSFSMWCLTACRGALDKKVEVIHLYSQH
ncbi:MAG: hypothetical protein ACJAUW_002158, partial [Yoonia sp.]